MDSKKKTEVEVAAKCYAANAADMVVAWGQTETNLRALSRETIAYAKELARPCVPILYAGARMFRGSAEVGVWLSARLADTAHDLCAMREQRKSANDADGEPTEAETTDALESALVAVGLVPARPGATEAPPEPKSV